MRLPNCIAIFIGILYVVVGEDEAASNILSECENGVIFVEEITITCDSPGAYYYGGSNYRNSDTCVGGDKGRVEVILQIAEDLEQEPYVDVMASGYGHVGDASVHQVSNLCEVASAVDGAVCPQAGYYRLYDTFWFESQSDDNMEYSFSPKVSVGFMSTQTKRSYDLGGANTNHCSGDVGFNHWSADVKKTAATAFKTGMITFCVLASMIIAVSMMRQRPNTSSDPFAKETQAEEAADYQKMSMVANNATLVDA